MDEVLAARTCIQYITVPNMANKDTTAALTNMVLNMLMGLLFLNLFVKVISSVVAVAYLCLLTYVSSS